MHSKPLKDLRNTLYFGCPEINDTVRFSQNEIINSKNFFIKVYSYISTSCVYDSLTVVHKSLHFTTQVFFFKPSSPLQRGLLQLFTVLVIRWSEVGFQSLEKKPVTQIKVWIVRTVLMFLSLKKSCKRLALCEWALSHCHKLWCGGLGWFAHIATSLRYGERTVSWTPRPLFASMEDPWSKPLSWGKSNKQHGLPFWQRAMDNLRKGLISLEPTSVLLFVLLSFQIQPCLVL